MKNRIVSLAVLAMLVLLVGSISVGQSRSPCPRERHSMQKTIQELQRLASENAGSLRHSLTSSQEWTLVNPLPTDAELFRVRCEDNYALALAYPVSELQSVLWQTTDAGENWISKSLDQNTVALDVAREGNNLWAAGAVVLSPDMVNGVVAFSPNLGNSWTTMLAVDSALFGALYCFDDQNLIAAGIKLVGQPTSNDVASVFYHTTNGGQTWTVKRNRVIKDLNPFGGVCFASHNRGWLLHYNSGQQTESILATTDGGQTWAVQYTDSVYLTGVSFADSVHGWVIAYKHNYPDYGLQILATTNGGESWAVQRTLFDLTARGLLLAHDRNHVWFASERSSPPTRPHDLPNDKRRRGVGANGNHPIFGSD